MKSSIDLAQALETWEDVRRLSQERGSGRALCPPASSSCRFIGLRPRLSWCTGPKRGKRLSRILVIAPSAMHVPCLCIASASRLCCHDRVHFCISGYLILISLSWLLVTICKPSLFTFVICKSTILTYDLICFLESLVLCHRFSSTSGNLLFCRFQQSMIHELRASFASE